MHLGASINILSPVTFTPPCKSASTRKQSSSHIITISPCANRINGTFGLISYYKYIFISSEPLLPPKNYNITGLLNLKTPCGHHSHQALW